MPSSIVTLDITPDLDFAPPSNPTNPAESTTSVSSSTRTLLLAPPSLSRNQDVLSAVFSEHDRAVTDLHMLDRLAAGLVTLPPSTYTSILLLSDPPKDADTKASALPTYFLSRTIISQIVGALKPRGRIAAQTGEALDSDPTFAKEVVLAGLVKAADGNTAYEKPDYGEEVVVPLLRKDKKPVMATAAETATTLETKPVTTPAAPATPVVPTGVGFVNLDDDLDDDLDNDLIDENSLLTADDFKAINVPAECAPKAGKRRRACKDCTCGLAERLTVEDKTKRANANAKLAAAPVKLATGDLAEIDFTVQGKVGSCGSCALGDAFRCADCPYIGLPAFKPGEEVRILKNDIQL